MPTPSSFLRTALLLFGSVLVYGLDYPVAKDRKPIIPIPQTCRYYRTLLTFDGGSLRGYIATQILHRLEDEIKAQLLNQTSLLSTINSSYVIREAGDFHVDIADYFDAIAGVSAGSWVAVYIASKGGANQQSAKVFNSPKIRLFYGNVRPGSVKGLEVFFLEFSGLIYPPRIPPIAIRPRFWRASQLKIAYLTVPKHPSAGLDATLKLFLGDTLLSEMATSLLVIAYDLNFRSATQFTLDRLDPLRQFQRVSEIVSSTLALDDCTKDLQTIEKDTPEYAAAVERAGTECQVRLDVTAAARGTGRFGDIYKRIPVVKKVTVGRVSTVVPQRYYNDICDYLHPGMTFNEGPDFLARDLARSSSAFPALQGAEVMQSANGYGYDHLLIDGAMVGNNPTLQAWVWMSNRTDIQLNKIATFSIGTGTVQQDLRVYADGGYLDWMMPVMGIVLDSSSEYWQSNLDFLFYRSLREIAIPNQYLRIQANATMPSLGAIAITVSDLPINLPIYRAIGRRTGDLYQENIRAFVKNFIFGRCTNPEIKIEESKVLTEKIEEHKDAIQKFLNATKAAGLPPLKTKTPSPVPGQILSKFYPIS